MRAPIEHAAKNLVVRARQGDQNAIATIIEVRESALAGSPKAKRALSCIKLYISRTPQEASIGAEAEMNLRGINALGPVQGLEHVIELAKGGNDALWAGAVVLSFGDLLLDERIQALADVIPDASDREAFLYAAKNAIHNIASVAKTMMPDTRKVFLAGLCIGVAQSIQKVRTKGGSITRFSPMAGWELGEPLELQPSDITKENPVSKVASLLSGGK